MTIYIKNTKFRTYFTSMFTIIYNVINEFQAIVIYLLSCQFSIWQIMS